jgi:hypothetical protein
MSSIWSFQNAMFFAEYASILLIGIFCIWLTFGHAQAVSLSITGHCTGSGIATMNYTGSMLNVSLTQNGTAWFINATGAA